MTARRVVCPEAGRAELESFPEPQPGDGEVALAASLTLISPGTERAFMLGLPNTSGKYPYRPGYNCVGRITALGEGVGDALAVGDRVVAAAPHASAAVVSQERAIPVPDAVPDEAACFFNMLCIALQGVRKAKIELGEAVIVVGQGLVGQLAARLARLQGGAPVVGLDTSPERRELATAGADRVLDPAAADFRGTLDGVLGGEGGAPVVIEATGAPEPIRLALSLARRMGRVVLLGSTRGVTDGVNFYADVHKKGLQILGAHASAIPTRDSAPGGWTWADNCRAVLRLLATGRLRVQDLITHRFPADRAAEAFALLANWDPTLLGVVLRWSEGD